MAPLLTGHSYDGFRIAVYDSQQNAGSMVRNAAALLPILQGTRIKTKSVCEFLMT